VSIPAQEKKRGVVLRYLRDRCFAEDRDYPEREVNALLGRYHPDTASLRRSMIGRGPHGPGGGGLPAGLRRIGSGGRGRWPERVAVQPGLREIRPGVYSPATTGSITP